jgi:hypothetical protein
MLKKSILAAALGTVAICGASHAKADDACLEPSAFHRFIASMNTAGDHVTDISQSRFVRRTPDVLVCQATLAWSDGHSARQWWGFYLNNAGQMVWWHNENRPDPGRR